MWDIRLRRGIGSGTFARSLGERMGLVNQAGMGWDGMGLGVDRHYNPLSLNNQSCSLYAFLYKSDPSLQKQ